MGDTHINSEIFKPLVLCKPLPQFGVDVYVAPRVLEKSPELLQAIQLTYTHAQRTDKHHRQRLQTPDTMTEAGSLFDLT